jgi:hypothetical protein
MLHNYSDGSDRIDDQTASSVAVSEFQNDEPNLTNVKENKTASSRREKEESDNEP